MAIEIKSDPGRTFQPEVTPGIWRLRPDFRAVSIVAKGFDAASGAPWAAERLSQACRAAAAAPSWAEAHLAAWQDAYRAFGANPRRTPSSAEALRKRALRDGGMASINAVVDLYNAVSIAHAIPVGGEDIDRYVGLPRLTLATGQEPFETTRNGEPAIERPDVGEVIWRDDRGVTCRRWNWRQGPRTRISDDSRNLWFVLERLEPMPLEGLLAAAQELIAGLQGAAPRASVTMAMIGPEN
jgi:DNA/RNA-binding domain of Phe-tRNA-synthetase-like protein